VPVCAIAWPVAILTDHLALTFAVFIGVYVATKLEPAAGAADGKLMVGLAALAPLVLGIGALLEVVVFAALRLRGRRDAAIPGALCLYRRHRQCDLVRRHCSFRSMWRTVIVAGTSLPIAATSAIPVVNCLAGDRHYDSGTRGSALF
jgi:hypothetical protein